MISPQSIIVIGASAGGVDALKQVVRDLPSDLPAAVFVVLHIGVHPSILPEILGRAGPLPAVHAIDGAPIEGGLIYVAPPDHHLLLTPGHMDVTRGPKENNARPAVNTLFRTAASAYGERVVGVRLTGGLNDGTVGLWEIKRHGGITVVQDPKEAQFPSMPRSALENVEIDYCVRLSQIPSVLAVLARGKREGKTRMEISPQISTRIDSSVLLPMRGRCLMKMLPVNHGVTDEEAIEPGDTQRVDRSSEEALSRSGACDKDRDSR